MKSFSDRMMYFIAMSPLLPLSKAIGYIHQLLHAVSSAHPHSLVPRDIKPANIMLNKKGEIRRVDLVLPKPLTDKKVPYRNWAWVAEII